MLAGSLYDRFTGLVQGSVDAIICTRVRFLDQGLELKKETTERKTKYTHTHMEKIQVPR